MTIMAADRLFGFELSSSQILSICIRNAIHYNLSKGVKHITLLQIQFVIHVLIYVPDIDLYIDCISFKVCEICCVSRVCAFIELGVCLEIEQQQQQKEMSIHLKIQKVIQARHGIKVLLYQQQRQETKSINNKTKNKTKRTVTTTIITGEIKTTEITREHKNRLDDHGDEPTGGDR